MILANLFTHNLWQCVYKVCVPLGRYHFLHIISTKIWDEIEENKKATSQQELNPEHHGLYSQWFGTELQ